MSMEYPDKVLDALGHEVRRNILDLLKQHPMSVGTIAEHFAISRPGISKHLRILEKARLVEHEPQGTRNIFRLRAEGFQAAQEYLNSFWDEALTNFQNAVENTEDSEA